MNIIPQKQGLSAFQLKLIALIFMTFDHIYYYLNGILPIPSVFTVIGRLAAPIFFFILCDSFDHTRNRYKYAIRLYLFSVGMGIINIIKGIILPHPLGMIYEGNIFATMFLVVYVLICLEKIRSGAKKNNIHELSLGALGIAALLALQAIFLFVPLGAKTQNLSQLLTSTVLPMPITAEGSIIFIFFGVMLYYMRKQSLSVFYIAFSLVFLAAALPYGFTAENLLADNCQWAMVFALPFMLAYNGERGRHMKYLFYFYYPIHKVVLTVLSIVIAA